MLGKFTCCIQASRQIFWKTSKIMSSWMEVANRRLMQHTKCCKNLLATWKIRPNLVSNSLKETLFSFTQNFKHYFTSIKYQKCKIFCWAYNKNSSVRTNLRKLITWEFFGWCSQNNILRVRKNIAVEFFLRKTYKFIINFGLRAKIFRQGCENCILCVQRNMFGLKTAFLKLDHVNAKLANEERKNVQILRN